ncbi:MAG TPA: hypothetical protein VJQ47_09760 [Steroidobacteraceae bacterium]|nr:hypothetical protein [Steroidobacteraceae bacterium]
MIIYGADRSKLMEIEKFSREGNTLRFRGKIMGAMPVTAVVTPQQVRAMLKGLGFSLLLFAISMLFRKDAGPTAPK